MDVEDHVSPSSLSSNVLLANLVCQDITIAVIVPLTTYIVEEESVDVSMSSLLGGTAEKISSPPLKRRRVREVKKPPKQPVITRPVETASKKPKPPTRPTRSSSNASSHSSLEADDLLEKM